MSDPDHTQTHKVTPLSIYLGVAGALLALTALTVRVSFIDFGPWNMVVALAIAGVKMTLVALVFMHLYQDNKLYFVVFTAAIIFLVIFIMFTMFDTMERGAISEERAQPIRNSAARYDSLSRTEALSDSLSTSVDTSADDTLGKPTD